MYVDKTVFPICNPRASGRIVSMPLQLMGAKKILTQEESNLSSHPMPAFINRSAPKDKPDCRQDGSWKSQPESHFRNSFAVVPASQTYHDFVTESSRAEDLGCEQAYEEPDEQKSLSSRTVLLIGVGDQGSDAANPAFRSASLCRTTNPRTPTTNTAGSSSSKH